MIKYAIRLSVVIVTLFLCLNLYLDMAQEIRALRSLYKQCCSESERLVEENYKYHDFVTEQMHEGGFPHRITPEERFLNEN